MQIFNFILILKNQRVKMTIAIVYSFAEQKSHIVVNVITFNIIKIKQ